MGLAVGAKHATSSDGRGCFRNTSIIATIVALHIGFVLLFTLDGHHSRIRTTDRESAITLPQSQPLGVGEIPFTGSLAAKPSVPRATLPIFDVAPLSVTAPPEKSLSVALPALATPMLDQSTVAADMGHLASLGLGARDANGVCHELSQPYLDQLGAHMLGNLRSPFFPYAKHPVVLVFAFDQNGKLLRLERVKTSGSDHFDAFVMHHINAVSPMPPIPTGEHVVFYQDLLVVGLGRHAGTKFTDDHCHKVSDDPRLDD